MWQNTTLVICLHAGITATVYLATKGGKKEAK